jgi:hypothetical protein
MAKQDIGRLYHAAIAVPRPGANEYDDEPPALAQAVRHVLATAWVERDGDDPPPRSIGWPQFGAGRGGVQPATSFAWLWTALERELAEHGPWDIHFIARRRVAATSCPRSWQRPESLPGPGRARLTPGVAARKRACRAGGQSGVSCVRRWAVNGQGYSRAHAPGSPR